MSLPLPNLDDRTYDDLVAELRAMIPGLLPEWTDHNPSDPGITLVELFAWLTEILLYRIDRVSDDTVRAFLRLLEGAEWTPGNDLEADVEATLRALREPYRAVTAHDYETLALQVPGVARARCVPRHDLSATTAEARAEPRPGWVSLIVMPALKVDQDFPPPIDPDSPPTAPRPSTDLLSRVQSDFAPRRLLAVRQAVVGPLYAPVAAKIVLARRPDALAEPVKKESAGVRQDVVDALNRWLDPHSGGPDGRGWPFGRDVFVSELLQVLEGVAGVDYVTDVELISVCPPGSKTFCQPADELWHDSGDPIGLALGADLLPWSQIEVKSVVVGLEFVPVALTVGATDRRKAKTALRHLFHPLYGGPDGQRHADGSGARWIGEADVRTALQQAGDVRAFTGGSGRLPPAGQGRGVWVEAGQLADLTIEVVTP